MLSCNIYNGTGGWLGINLLVLLVMFLIVAIFYLMTRVLPEPTKGKLTGITRVEITELVLSAILIMTLVGISSLACSLTTQASAALVPTTISSQYQGSIPCPTNTITVPPSDPVTYAEYYTGFLALVVGPNVATQVYDQAYSETISSTVWGSISAPLEGAVAEGSSALFPGLTFGEPPGPQVTVAPVFGYDLSVPFSSLAAVSLDLFIPVVLIGISVSFIQYLILIVTQVGAFTLILPIAIIMRSLAFAGPGIRTAANGLLAIAIAMYLVFPLTVAFDSYAVNWMFTQCSTTTFTPGCNPSSAYLCQTYSYQDYSQSLLSSIAAQPIIYINVLGFQAPLPNVATVFTVVTSNLLDLGNINGVIYDVLLMLNSVSEYFFETVIMFVINISITIGFAMGLARALNGGVEGSAAFWSNV